VAREALSSSEAAFYTVKGVYHLLAHPSLTKPLRLPLLFSALLSGVTIVTLFTFTYIPHVIVFTFFNGPLAFLTVIPMIFGEASAIVTFIARLVWLGPALEDTFDQVLLERGHIALVSRGREFTAGREGIQVGKLLTQPFNRFNKESILRFLISLPLNAIPIIGPFLFLAYNGSKAGPTYHNRYFQLKGFNEEQKKRFIHKRRGAYVSFGTAALGLNLVPFVSLFLQFSTVAGAALWASDEERMSGARRDIIDGSDHEEMQGEGSGAMGTRKRTTGARAEL
jgi:uncharacterized protein involved in cysteine biosynthesis